MTTIAGDSRRRVPRNGKCSRYPSPRRALLVLTAALLSAGLADGARAEEPMAARIERLAPELQSYIESGMGAFDTPGLAIGIVTGDRLVYARGFGVRKKGGEPVDAKTVFQIGSTTKAFLATTMAIAVDRKKFAWDDRVVDLDPDFQLKDAWVTREFRVFDLIAQRSGMPAHANDVVGMLGADQPAMIRSLRHVEPVSSFRSPSPIPTSPTFWPNASWPSSSGPGTGTPSSARTFSDPSA